MPKPKTIGTAPMIILVSLVWGIFVAVTEPIGVSAIIVGCVRVKGNPAIVIKNPVTIITIPNQKRNLLGFFAI